MNVLTAGMDPVAGTLTFSVYMLSQHPDVLARLREEIIAKVGISGRPTHDDLRDMKYLRAFINGVQCPIASQLNASVLMWCPCVRGSSAVSSHVRCYFLDGKN